VQFVSRAIARIHWHSNLTTCFPHGIKTANYKSRALASVLKLVLLPGLLFLLVLTSSAWAQTAVDEVKPTAEGAPYTRLNSWSVFSEYSPNSSHMFLGVSQQRRLLIFGGEYARRLLLTRWVGLHYLAQARPVILENDPALVGFRSLNTGQLIVQFPRPVRLESVNDAPILLDIPPRIVRAFPVYTQEWTYAGGINPLGIKLNLLPRHRIQPVFSSTAGFLLSSRDIPVDHSSNFNFSFDFGAGIEWFQSSNRSVRLDYRLHHISNASISTTNPGIDSGLFQLSYSFGK
jgi:Lipid A 3-O-deacylase (PagL)